MAWGDGDLVGHGKEGSRGQQKEKRAGQGYWDPVASAWAQALHIF